MAGSIGEACPADDELDVGSSVIGVGCFALVLDLRGMTVSWVWDAAGPRSTRCAWQDKSMGEAGCPNGRIR
jgi:hypothetical protein